MLETATAFENQGKQDAGYASWRASVKTAIMRRDPEGRTAGPIPVFGAMVRDTALAAQGVSNAYSPSSTLDTGRAYPDIAYETKEEGFNFGDIIDMINPLQHLPVIGTLYRKFTGDEIKPVSNIIGGAIFGGPVGAVSSTVNAIIKDRTGKDVAENALSFVGVDMGGKSALQTDITYETTKQVSSNNMAAANIYERAADGRKNFATRADSYSTQSWNV